MRTGNGFFASAGITFKLGLAITLAAAIVLVVGPGWQKRIDTAAADRVKRVLGGSGPSGKVVIVRADAESIQRLGPWPWSMSVHARLINMLNAAGASVVAFQFPFSTQGKDDRARLDFIRKKFLASGLLASGREGIEFYRVLTENLPEDEALGEVAEALAGFHRVVLPATVGSGTGEDPGAAGIPLDKSWPGFSPPKVKLGSLPPESLRKWAAGLGATGLFPDGDGTLRSGPLFVEAEERLVPALGLEMIRVLEGLAPGDVRPVAGQGVRLGNRLLPTDSACRLFLNYRDPGASWATFSYADVIDGSIPSATLNGRAVLVAGPEASGSLRTPLAEMDQALWTATLADNIYAGDPLRPAGWVQFFGLLLLLACGFITSTILDRASFVLGLAGAVLLSLSVIGLAGLFIARWNLIFDFAAISALPILILAAAAGLRFPGVISPPRPGTVEVSPGLSSSTLGSLEVAWSNPSPETGGMFVDTVVSSSGASTLLLLSTDRPSGYLPGLCAMARSLVGRGHTLEDVAEILGEAYFREGEGLPALRFLGLTFHNSSREMSLLNSGHPSPLLVKSGQRGFKSLGGRGEPLGGESAGSSWVVKSIFEKGDLLVCTVGLKDTLVQERLGEIAGKLRDGPASRIARRLNLTLASSRPGGGHVPGVVVLKYA